MKPFIKWYGGKTRLFPEIDKYIPLKFGRYFEPFLGGGAVLFHLAEQGRLRDKRSSYGRAVLSDVNRELVNAYCVVRDSPEVLIAQLEKIKQTYEASQFDKYYYYYDQRSLLGIGSPEVRAARFIFVNKQCFNGLWRENELGQMNASWGQYYNPEIYKADNIRACSEALQGCNVFHQDFQKTLDYAMEGDFAYFDPPYVPMTSTANFTQYSQLPFGAKEQERVRDLALALKEHGVKVLLSNSDTPIVRDLYARGFEVRKIDVYRGGAGGNGRGIIGEVLIT